MGETHNALTAHHLQQVQQFGAIAEIVEQIHDQTWRPPLSQHTHSLFSFIYVHICSHKKLLHQSCNIHTVGTLKHRHVHRIFTQDVKIMLVIILGGKTLIKLYSDGKLKLLYHQTKHSFYQNIFTSN